MPLDITVITQQINLLEAIISIFPQAYFSSVLFQIQSFGKNVADFFFPPVYVEQKKQ